MNYAVILAGGIGSRFWPLSRTNEPKQFLNICSKKQMLEETIRRIGSLVKRDNIYIATNKIYHKKIKNYLKKLNIHPRNILFEPETRNTLAPLGLLSKNIYAKDNRTKKWHDIGTFHMIIGMLSSLYDQNNTVRIFNTKHLGMGMNNGFQAPHVWEDGHACHGNLAIGMTEAYKNRNLFDLVYQIIIFLQSANTSDSAGQHVDSWPEVTEEEALGKIKSRDIAFIYNKKDEVEEKYDNMLAEALPIKITR